MHGEPASRGVQAETTVSLLPFPSSFPLLLIHLVHHHLKLASPLGNVQLT